jgi:hypothetical protein
VTDEDLRLAIYQSFATTGRAPAIDDRGALRRLAQQRHVVLDADGHILLAHPFSSIPMGFSVIGQRTLWWGGCAWDSFALPHLLPDEPCVLVATTCPACGRALAWNVDRHAPPRGDEVAHFLVPASAMWNDVVHTCGHQRLFCSETCVGTWLASHWYDGRLERGYKRREPAEAKAYFRDVGLRGPFWGL